MILLKVFGGPFDGGLSPYCGTDSMLYCNRGSIHEYTLIKQSGPPRAEAPIWLPTRWVHVGPLPQPQTDPMVPA